MRHSKVRQLVGFEQLCLTLAAFGFLPAWYACVKWSRRLQYIECREVHASLTTCRLHIRPPTSLHQRHAISNLSRGHLPAWISTCLDRWCCSCTKVFCIGQRNQLNQKKNVLLYALSLLNGSSSSSASITSLEVPHLRPLSHGITRPPTLLSSHIKQLPQLRHRLLGVLHTMPDRPLVLVDLVVVAALVRLVTEEVDSRKVDAVGQVLVGLDVLQAVRLVPARGEDVEGYLAADGVAVPTLVPNCYSLLEVLRI